jgi:hypothetical protein
MPKSLCDLRAFALREFPNARQGQEIRVVMDTKLCRCIAFRRDDMRVANTFPRAEIGHQARYTAIGRVIDFGQEERQFQAQFFGHCASPGVSLGAKLAASPPTISTTSRVMRPMPVTSASEATKARSRASSSTISITSD